MTLDNASRSLGWYCINIINRGSSRGLWNCRLSRRAALNRCITVAVLGSPPRADAAVAMLPDARRSALSEGAPQTPQAMGARQVRARARFTEEPLRFD